ncbi:putative potassium channel beta subunit protein [Tilletiopsis washingtonensis]|uniref:Putative potassium channel beta subunit protein n=1 Tax=Tilletiopsis washingtonensis TaxID=58919 RepID=A0A316Z8F7_9BASI|nr:putative potassium channel beta subunit protein [Tilletiopsis washingtonensis]PWN97278.1 putative potassium channel beta subunit protein [Tilletiopsis washingtonensis]
MSKSFVPADAAVFDPKNMLFQRLGDSGLRVSRLSLGSWLTYGGTVDEEGTQALLDQAFKAGINTFDTAETYSGGLAEIAVGKAIKNLKWRRSDVVLITKIFFGTATSKEPNARGLSRKHIIEGTNDSLERAGLTYWDAVFAHRPDPTVPMHEIVRAFNHLIDQGKAFYWGTSEWSAQQIEEAHGVAHQLGLIAPICDQAQYSALHRERVEVEYAPLYKKYDYGLTIWSPLKSGILTGKYNDATVPSGSRFETNAAFFKDSVDKLKTEEGKAELAKVARLGEIAKKLGTSTGTLAIAWCLANPHVSTVLLGATKASQLEENLKAIEVLPKLTSEVLKEIDGALENVPAHPSTFGRTPI